MGQKVNPISLRLQKTNRHFDSCWYDDYNYTHLLLQDLKIQKYLNTVLHQIKYPESRILSLGAPKKNIINIFYYNPSNSRRKKSGTFQLQNFKDSNKKRFFGGKKNVKDIHSFFSFPEQQYWKNNSFLLAQQQIKGLNPKVGINDSGDKFLLEQTPLVTKRLYKSKKGYKKNEEQYKDYFSVSDPKQNLYLLSKKYNVAMSTKLSKSAVLVKNEYTDEQQTSIKQNIHENKPETNQGFVRAYRKFCFTKTKQYIDLKNKEYKEPFYQKKNFCFSFPDFNPFFSNKKSVLYEYLKVLQFVIKNNSINDYQQKSVEKSMVKERFFVRYLLAQFYCNILQNKEKYSIESYTILYRFLVFFQEKNVENNKYRNVIQNLTNRSEKYSNDVKKGLYNKRSIFQSTKNDVSSLTKKNNFLHYPKGVYSSNLVYKSHLEYTLSKQYSSFYNLNFFRTLIEKQSACFLVQEIIHYLEKKIPFRRIKTQIIRDIPHYKNIKGIRIKCSGRVGGRSKKAQRSKTQSIKIGQTSLGVFSSKIDFACKSAYTRFGLIGVKVWVCYQ